MKCPNCNNYLKEIDRDNMTLYLFCPNCKAEYAYNGELIEVQKPEN